MTVRDADVESSFDDPDDGWFGAALPAEDVPTQSAREPSRPATERRDDFRSHPDAHDDADTDRWFVQDMGLPEPVATADPPRLEAADHRVAESVAATLTVVPTRRHGFVKASAPASWESRLSNSGAWEFKATSGAAWYRSRAAMTAAAIVAGVLAVVGMVLILRAPAAEEPTPVAPSQSAAPPAPTAPSSAPPALSSVVPLPPPPPPPGPPPPPPPSAEEISPPVVQRQYTPRYQTPDEPKKPQTNVTRAPMSATPPPPPRQTNQGHGTPGDSGGCRGFFC